MSTTASWSHFVSSPRAVVAGFLAAIALLFTGINQEQSTQLAAGQLMLSLIALGWVAVLAYRDEQPATVEA